MASIVKRGKTYSIVYYEGEGKNKHQVWESGLSYNAARSRKAQLEYEMAQNVHVEKSDLTVNDFLHEFIKKYGEKRWVASTYDGNVGLIENYVYPYLGDKMLRSIRTKTVDDYYHFLLFKAEPVTNQGKPKRERITPSTIHDIHKVLRCAFNQAVKWEYIAKNPFLNATLPEHKEKKRAALTPEQLYKVMEFTDRPDIYDYYLMHCAIHLAFACSMRGGEVGGAQWSRLSDQMLYMDRVIDRVDKKLADSLSKMDIMYRFPNLYPGTRTVIVLKQPKTEGSIRHTSAGVKLRLSGGDLKAVQGDGGWSTPDMVTKRYAHILDEDRRTLAAEMEKQFYQTAGNLDAPKPMEQPAPAAPVIDASALATLLTSNPELLAQVIQSIQSANRA